MAALFTSTSIRPKRSCTASTAAWTDASSAMSVGTGSTSPRADSSSAVEPHRPSSTSAMATRAPSARKRLAYSRPMPPPAPVMMATRPSSRPMSAT